MNSSYDHDLHVAMEAHFFPEADMTTAKKQTYPIRAEFNEVLTKEFLQNGDFDTAKLTMRDVANAMIEYIGENEHSGDCKLKDLRKLAEGFADFFLFLGFEATNSK